MFSASSSAQFGASDLGYSSTKKFKLLHWRDGFLLNWKQNTVLYVHLSYLVKDNTFQATKGWWLAVCFNI